MSSQSFREENASHPLNLIFVGRPGSGKGTQAKLIASSLTIPHISTGDIFRQEMLEKTPLGLQIIDSMNAGQYTSDEITNAVIEKRLSQPDAQNGFILDGYPRTINQVEFLNLINIPIVAVINLNLDEDKATKRILKRALGNHRGDDTAETIKLRMETYTATVLPIIEFYLDEGKLWNVDASLDLGTVNLAIEKIVKQLNPQTY